MQSGVDAAQSQQCVMIALLHHPPLVHNEDAVGLAHRTQPMRDDEYRATTRDGAHVFLDDALGFIVERTGRLVEDQNAGIGDQGPCDRDSLALPAGKI